MNKQSDRGEGFSEAPAWRATRGGWRPLFGGYRSLGFCFEWHDFSVSERIDWARSFHPGGVELCLNLEGSGVLRDGRTKVEVGGRTSVFYRQGDPPLEGERVKGERHRFITVEYAPDFLKEHLGREGAQLHPCVRGVVEGGDSGGSVLAEVQPMRAGMMQLVESLRSCPVFKSAHETWFRCKALELAAQTFFQAPEGEELFCTRQQRARCERAVRVREILMERLENPPSLKELGQMVGCSPFHLSRQFSEATGKTIQQFLRQVRLERAADLLRSGKCNVTEAAMEVGYSSLSHFTVAFREQYGCCPGLYPSASAARGS